MADDHVFTNIYMAYIGNKPYNYPDDNPAKLMNSAADTTITTGWHILPNMLWRHFVTPKQFAEFQIKYEAYKVNAIKIKVFNMVPMTHQLAIQGTSIFTAFNNTLYGWGYKDDLYESSWFNWYVYSDQNAIAPNLMYKEGLQFNYGQETKFRYLLPIYQWHPPNSRRLTINTYHHNRDIVDGNGEQLNTNIPNYPKFNLGLASKPDSESGVFPTGKTSQTSEVINQFNERPSGVIWDPLNRPDHIMELRPGKNTMQYSWNTHECDQHKWFNLDLLAWWYPYTETGPYHSFRGRPGQGMYKPYCDPDRLSTRFENDPWINDYTIPNWANLPVVPSHWWWHEIGSSVMPYSDDGIPNMWHYMDMFFRGTEAESHKYPPTQCFIKLIPLFDGEGTLIETSANISIQTELFVTGKPRRSAYYGPTWGPFDWRSLYSGKSRHRFFEPAKIRYRTGGMRRTWQNISDEVDDNQAVSWNRLARQFRHPREVPLDTKVNPAGTGAGGTYQTSFRRFKREYYKDADKKPPKPSAPPMDIDPGYPGYQKPGDPLHETISNEIL